MTGPGRPDVGVAHGVGQYLHFGRCACKRQLVPSRTSADLGEQKANQAVRGPLGSLVIPLRHGQTSVMAIPGKSPVPRKGPRSTPPGPVGACISQNARASGNSYLHGHQRPPETPPCDTTLRPEGDGFEPSVPRERDCLTRLPRLTATAFPCGREGRTRLPHAPSGGLTQWRAANVRVIGLISERVTVLTISGKLPTASAEIADTSARPRERLACLATARPSRKHGPTRKRFPRLT